MKEYQMDVKHKTLGRAASEAAAILRGKKETDFAPNQIPELKLIVLNANQIKINEKKISEKTYKHFSGYPGGLKITSMKKILKDKGIEYALKKAIYGMLPKNKLRAKMIKNLIIQPEKIIK